jgi:hypothetical protein
MNSLTNMISRTSLAFAVVVFGALSVGVLSAKAADMTVNDYIYPESIEYWSSPISDMSDVIYPESIDYFSGASSFGGFSTPSFFGGGFGGGGFHFSNSNTNVNTNTQTQVSTCTSPNSCNDNSIFNAPTTVTVTNPAPTPTIVYQQPPVYTPPPVYYPPIPPTYYPQPPRQPYVALSATPYTGLELGPLGTALYWSFLVLWCALAAYLVVVKRVQNKVFAGLNSFLFGSTASHTSQTAQVAHARTPMRHSAPVAAPVEDGIDPFIASQITRTK